MLRNALDSLRLGLDHLELRISSLLLQVLLLLELLVLNERPQLLHLLWVQLSLSNLLRIFHLLKLLVHQLLLFALLLLVRSFHGPLGVVDSGFVRVRTPSLLGLLVAGLQTLSIRFYFFHSVLVALALPLVLKPVLIGGLLGWGFWRQAQLLVKALSELLELRQAFAEVKVLEVAASVRVLVFTVGVVVEVYSLEVVEVEIVNVRVGFLHFVETSLVHLA